MAHFMLSAGASAADSPRQRLSMDFGWKFTLGDPAGAQAVKFDESGWQAVDLPHDWSIAGSFDESAPAGGGGGFLPTGIGWYRKTFRVPDSFKGKKIAVEFDGVYENSEVWINNHWLGKRPFGYIGFSYDLTPYLNFSQQDNVIAVRVDNSMQPNSRWYSGSGIYRHTWLTVTDPLSIAPWGAYITTPKATEERAAIQIVVQIANRRDASARFSLVAALLDQDGREINSVRSEGELDAGVSGQFTQLIRLDHPNLWSEATPYLYTVRCTLLSGEKVVDQYDTPIGVRSIAFDVDKGFLLNGRQVKLNGVCLHGDGGCVGAAVPEGVWLRRLKLLKEMGCNAIRTSHNPPAPEFLDLCDRLGFLVMDEAFDEWTAGKTLEGYHRFFAEWSQRDLVDFIHRDRNHPCVVLWSAGNEIGEQTLPDGADVLRPLVETYHREDATRLVTAACDKAFAEPLSAPPEFTALLDVVGYNYVDRWLDRTEKYYSLDRREFPQRKFIGTESVSMGGTRGDYSGLFYSPASTQPTAPPPTTRPGRRRFRQLPPSNRRIDVEQLWKFVRTNDYVSGDFMWTGFDYLGEAFWPSKSAPFGVLDTCGFKKDGFYFYQSQWTSKPVLHLFPHWNWKGREGQIIPVTCYTNCDTVELFVNGKSFGLKGYQFPREGMAEDYGNLPPRARLIRTTGDLHLSWDVPYEPGTLRAVGTTASKVVATEQIATAGDPAAVELSADKTRLAADGRDVAHLTVRIVDADGRTVPTADNQVTFELEGPGQIIGVDNGDPASHESFKANHHKAFNGMCLAIVQAARSAGSIRVTANSDALRSGLVELKCEPAAQTPLSP
ncbi:MAG: glycoside hydrolase family 2 TIM barrel-domain containing protein [Tepidisphaeraceae bacterium]